MYSKNQSISNKKDSSKTFNKRTVVELKENQMVTVNGGCVDFEPLGGVLFPKLP